MARRTYSSSWTAIVWKAATKQAGILLLLSIVSAGILWGIRADKLPLVADPEFYKLELTAPLVTIAEALVYFDEGEHLFVDVRSEKLAGESTIPGSFFIREATLDDDIAANIDFLFPEDKIILFGTGDLMAPANVAARLQDMGFQDILILNGGLEAWTGSGGSVSHRSPPELEEAS